MPLTSELFCPLDGGGLSKSKWKPQSNSDSLICSRNHLWDVRKHSYLKGGLEFSPVRQCQCECGEVMPERDMRSIDSKKVCATCFGIAKKAWRMDSEQSYARLEVTPIRTKDGLFYQVHTTIQVRPYPNPFAYGGVWGIGAVTEQGLQKEIEAFERQVAELKENGMERIEIVRRDEVVRSQQVELSVNSEDNETPADDPEDNETPADDPEDNDGEAEAVSQLSLF